MITLVMNVSFAVLMPVARLFAGRHQPATAGQGATAGR
jgi:hypothetical protein